MQVLALVDVQLQRVVDSLHPLSGCTIQQTPKQHQHNSLIKPALGSTVEQFKLIKPALGSTVEQFNQACTREHS